MSAEFNIVCSGVCCLFEVQAVEKIPVDTRKATFLSFLMSCVAASLTVSPLHAFTSSVVMPVCSSRGAGERLGQSRRSLSVGVLSKQRFAFPTGWTRVALCHKFLDD